MSNTVSLAAAHVHAALIDAANGATRVRVHLSTLRAALPQWSRCAVDAALVELSRIGELALFPLDDRWEIRSADRDAALDLYGVDQHVAYVS